MSETKEMSALDILRMNQETYEDAKNKSNKESGSKAKYFRIDKDGTVTIRILPLVPVIDKDGKPVLPMERTGYEYPVREQLLKIKSATEKKFSFVSVCNAKYAFPQLKDDLIDLYVRVACELYADDAALCKKIQGNNFEGGLKYTSERCMYIYDKAKRADGLQIFKLTYSQYKDLEDRKLKLWEKLLADGPAPCPISSLDAAWPVEITRATEKKKTTYSFNIDLVAKQDQLSEAEAQALLEAPRLPEILYRYTRYHLEAVIAFLKQYDEEKGIHVMDDPRIKDCIDQIKLLLPASDQSHFKVDGKDDDSSNGDKLTIDDLLDMYEGMVEAGLDDQTEEGQNLRATIKEFIEDNELTTRVARGKSNADILEEIQDELAANANGGEESEEQAAEIARKGNNEEEEEEAPAAAPSAPAEEEAPKRNDDTQEPAVRPERRTARPLRRR